MVFPGVVILEEWCVLKDAPYLVVDLGVTVDPTVLELTRPLGAITQEGPYEGVVQIGLSPRQHSRGQLFPVTSKSARPQIFFAAVGLAGSP